MAYGPDVEHASDASLIIARALQLLTSDEDLTVRHVAALLRVAKQHAAGVQLRDIKQLAKLLDVTFLALENHTELKEPCHNLLRQYQALGGGGLRLQHTTAVRCEQHVFRSLQHPIVGATSPKAISNVACLLRSIAAYVCGDDVPEFLGLAGCEIVHTRHENSILEFGRTLCSDEHFSMQALQALVSNSLPDWHAGHEALAAHNQLWLIDHSDMQKLVGESGVVQSLTKRVTDTHNESMIVAILKVLLCWSRHGSTVQLLLAEQSLFGAVAFALKRLEASMHSVVTSVAIDLLWDIIDAMPPPRTIAGSLRCASRTSGPAELDALCESKTIEEGVIQSCTFCAVQAIKEDNVADSTAESEALVERMISSPVDFTPPEFRSTVLKSTQDLKLSKSLRQSASIARAHHKLRITRSSEMANEVLLASQTIASATSLNKVSSPDHIQTKPTKETVYSNRKLVAQLLHGLLKEAWCECFDQDSRRMCNSVLTVLLQLSADKAFCNDIEYIGLFHLLSIACTAPDLKQPTSIGFSSRGMCPSDALACEQRQLLWAILGSASARSKPCLSCALKYDFVNVLVAYIWPATSQNNKFSSNWLPDQSSSLRSSALDTLFQLAPVCPDEIVAANGSNALLEVVKSSCLHRHAEAAIQVVTRLIKASEYARGDLLAHGIVQVMCAKLSDEEPKEALRHDAAIALHAYFVYAMDTVSEEQICGVVDQLLNQLYLLCEGDATLPNYYLLEIIALTWFLLKRSEAASRHFVLQRGIAVILELLESCNSAVQPALLSLLVDTLSSSPLALKHLQQWTSCSSKRTAVQLLLEIWRDLEQEWGVCRNGVLTNVKRPLAGLGKRSLWVPYQEVQYGFMAVEKREEIRKVINSVSIDEKMCKLYCIFHILGFNSISELTAKDQAVLTLIEKYCKFKQGEIWMEIKNRFHATGFRPNASDNARLQSGIEFSEHLATVVLKEQHRLCLQEEGTKEAEERKFYQEKLEQVRRERDHLSSKTVSKGHQSAREKEAARQAREKMMANSQAEVCNEIQRRIDEDHIWGNICSR